MYVRAEVDTLCLYVQRLIYYAGRIIGGPSIE